MPDLQSPTQNMNPVEFWWWESIEALPSLWSTSRYGWNLVSIVCCSKSLAWHDCLKDTDAQRPGKVLWIKRSRVPFKKTVPRYGCLFVCVRYCYISISKPDWTGIFIYIPQIPSFLQFECPFVSPGLNHPIKDNLAYAPFLQTQEESWICRQAIQVPGTSTICVITISSLSFSCVLLIPLYNINPLSPIWNHVLHTWLYRRC